LANPQDANQNNDVANVRVVVADQSGYAAGFVFNLFSPNGDGINDKVKIKLSQTDTLTGLEEQVISSYNIQIFNRYGQLIYEGLNLSSAEAWDGSFNGSEAPSGTYFYVLTYQKGTEEGTLEVTDKGWIQLIR
jgi:gliding motility-associated-like protein